MLYQSISGCFEIDKHGDAKKPKPLKAKETVTRHDGNVYVTLPSFVDSEQVKCGLFFKIYVQYG